MNCDWNALATEVIASLSQSEREESIAYLEKRIIPAAEVLPWAGLQRSFDEPVVVAFVDLEPALNWTHRGRYLVLGPEGGLRHEIDVDRPPFLITVSPDLCLVHLGRQSPEWAAVTRKDLADTE